MPIFVKSGSWLERLRGYKGELDLTQLISSLVPAGAGIWGQITGDINNQTDLIGLAQNKRQVLVDGPVVTWDFSLGNIATLTLGGNRTLQIINVNNEDFGVMDVFQDATGSRLLSLPGNIPTVGITLSGGAGQKDKLSFHKAFNTFDWSCINYGTTVPAAPAPILSSIATSLDGTTIELDYNKAMNDPTGKQAQFFYTLNGVNKTFNSCSLKAGDNTKIVLGCNVTIANGDLVTTTYTPGDISSTDTGLATAFSGAATINNVPTYTSGIPNETNYSFIVDPRNPANVGQSGTNVIYVKDSSGAGAGRTTTGGAGTMQYDSVNKFLNMNASGGGSSQFYTYPALINLTSDWTMAFVFKFPNISASFAPFTSAVGGNYLNFVFSSAGGNHLGLNIGSTIVIPTSSNPANQRFTSTSLKYRVIIRKTGTTITYMVNGVNFTSAATSIARDYFQRLQIQSTALGPAVYLYLQGGFISNTDRDTLDTFLQTI